jgi:hypothetical protein
MQVVEYVWWFSLMNPTCLRDGKILEKRRDGISQSLSQAQEEAVGPSYQRCEQRQ